MKIKEIEVSNFKCFRKMKLTLRNFNVIIGKNAAGKSNIINIIKFIKDILYNTIDEAIDLQGGINYLYNSNIRDKQPIKIRFVMDAYDDNYFRSIKLLYNLKNIMLEQYEVTLAIRPNKRGTGYKITENKVKFFYVQLAGEKKNKDIEEEFFSRLKDYKKKNRFTQECYLTKGKIQETFSGEITEEIKDALSVANSFFRYMLNEENNLVLKYSHAAYIQHMSGEESIKIYDFNPQKLKSMSIINRKNVLEEDGSNIANVLQRILKEPKEKKKLLYILKRLMPFIDDIYTEKSFNKSLYFKVKENNKNDLPSVLLSDGTVNIIAIIVALYFEKENEIVIIEEPEKNIHPKLVKQLVSLMKDVGHNKQVIITTHNTQFLSSLELNDIIYVYRNKNMFSEIERPSNNRRVKEFIKNELEIGDLFYEGLFTEKEM